MAVNTLKIAEDFGGANTLIVAAPEYTDIKSLAANTQETFTVPTGADVAIFSGSTNFYALANGTAVVPADVSNGSGAQLNPAAWLLTPRDDGTDLTTISVISEAICVVTVSYYKLKNKRN